MHDYQIGMLSQSRNESHCDANDSVQAQPVVPAVTHIIEKEQREVAAEIADYVTEYSTRLLDAFFSSMPETVYRQALPVEVCIPYAASQHSIADCSS